MTIPNRLPNITDQDILLLKVFDAVVKAGSFTAAEMCLNKSKSAISVHIATLEARLGQTLCRRGRSGFALTPEGEKIYEICKDLFADLDRFRDRVSRVTSLVGGTLTLALDDSLLSRHDELAGALANFKGACPDVFLNVYTTSPERVLQMLIATSADVGICAMPREVPGVVVHPLFEDELSLFCSSGHPLFSVADKDITEEMLAQFETVDLGSYQDPDMEAAMDPMRATARSGQASSRLLLILTGKMIGLLPNAFAAEWVARGRLKEIRGAGINISQKCYTVIRREVASSKVCGRLLSELKAAFASAPRRASTRSA